MMTKYKLAEQALRVLYPTLTGDVKTHIQEMMLAVSQARDKYVRALYFQNLGDGDNTIPQQYISIYEDVPLQYDSTKKRYYAMLPTRVIDLKDERGIYFVATMNDPEEALIPLKQTYVTMYKGLASFGIEDLLGYYPQRDRVYIVGSIGEAEKLTMGLVSSSDDIPPLDDFMIASDAEMDIVQMALAIYQAQKQINQDKIVNGNSDG